jgi:Transposase DDE domain
MLSHHRAAHVSIVVAVLRVMRLNRFLGTCFGLQSDRSMHSRLVQAHRQHLLLVKTDNGLGHVALDGKRLRGSQHDNSPGVHMLHAFSTKLQAAVGSLVVPPDSGECVAALELIKSLPLTGAVMTADAAFTYKPVVDAILERGADYFLFVKGNQPESKAELERAFVMPEPCSQHDVSPSGGGQRRADARRRAA